MNTELLVEMQNISKNFSVTKALANVNFELKAGEVHALMGENGAGKSTLMKILAGVYNPDEGKILIRGKEVEVENPKIANDLGIAFIHQELNVVPYLTVAENLALGSEPQTKWKSLDRKKIHDDALSKIARVRAPVDPSELMGNLTIGTQQIIEIARAISMNAQILILDEPTSGVSTDEKHGLMKTIMAALDAEKVTAIFVEHDVDIVSQYATRVAAWIAGRIAADGTPQQVLADPEVRKNVIGE